MYERKSLERKHVVLLHLLLFRFVYKASLSFSFLLSKTFLIDSHLPLLVIHGPTCSLSIFFNFSVLSAPKNPSAVTIDHQSHNSSEFTNTLPYFPCMYQTPQRQEMDFKKRINPLREYWTFSNLFNVQCQSVQPTALGQAPKL